MTKFRVVWRESYLFKAEVEADDAENAMDKAYESKGVLLKNGVKFRKVVVLKRGKK